MFVFLFKIKDFILSRAVKQKVIIIASDIDSISVPFWIVARAAVSSTRHSKAIVQFHN